MQPKKLVGFVLIGFLGLLSGCNEDDGKVEITGTVLCDGKPFPAASVAFIGNDGGAYGSGITDSAGNFKLRVAPGKNKVAVSKMNTENLPPVDPNADQSMPSGPEAEQMMKKAPKPLVAQKFTDPDKSGIVIDVTPDMAAVEIGVTSK